ncbi:hypothetical protein COCNU_02G009260 [Cocos nucifera]|uniref:Uncharacterized protein n=1 Tax=Cocos nucifera TaxID=13894 RepID=A0A8K0I004_COCNU|nr:hypothetical protein COCNU_02G009260 [Cocos nucifera]
MDALEVILEVEAPPSSELGAITKVTGSLMPSDSPAEACIPKPLAGGEKEVEKKKAKSNLRRSSGRKRDEVDLSLKEKSIEVEGLQEALCKKKNISVGLKITLGLEKEQKRKVEAEIAKLREKIFMQISEAMAQGIEEFMVFLEMRDLNIKFDQEAFNKSFEVCENRMASKFSKLDLNFPYEGAPKNEMEPSIDAADPPPIEPTIEELGLTNTTPDTSLAPPKV